MLTKEQVLEQVKAGRKSETIDGSDFGRLAEFFAVEHWKAFGFDLSLDANLENIPAPKDWNRENIMEQLGKDLASAFDKAIGKRGFSAGMMHGVVKMWMWVLEDKYLLDRGNELHTQYGLPFFKAVALKYDFPNEIGDDDGDESKYSCE